MGGARDPLFVSSESLKIRKSRRAAARTVVRIAPDHLFQGVAGVIVAGFASTKSHLNGSFCKACFSSEELDDINAAKPTLPAGLLLLY